MTANAVFGPICPAYHDCRVPSNIRAYAPFDVLVARKPRLPLRRNGVDEVGAGEPRHTDGLLPGPLQQLEHEESCPTAALLVDH